VEAEARSTRLHLGDGVIPLHDILDVLPEHTPQVIETPVAAKPLGRPHGANNPLPPTPRPSFNGT
jgi:hypothetical protein